MAKTTKKTASVTDQPANKSTNKDLKPRKKTTTKASRADLKLVTGFLLHRSKRFGIRRSQVTRTATGLAIVGLVVGSFFVGLGHGSNTKKSEPVKKSHQFYSVLKNKSGAAAQKLSLLPAVPLTSLTGCEKGSLDVIVAHEDDDLLFMNMDLASEISAGKCVRTVYITAGDDGHSRGYWGEREHGIQQAYAYMVGADNVWTEEAASVYGHLISVRHLVGHPSIGLIFVRLPDGNVNGGGFASNSYTSLEALATQKIERISTVDGSTTYSYTELKSLIANILRVDAPDDIFSQVSKGPQSVGDHSDHKRVGQMVAEVREITRPDSRLATFVGYTTNQMDSNLSYDQAQQKREIFLKYARDDSLICSGGYSCAGESTYQNYFYRKYRNQE